MTPLDPRAPVRRVHLIGICGTGMGSLAGLLADSSFEVRGSDESANPPISTMLGAKGIEVLSGYRAEHLDDRPDLVIVGNIATRNNPEAAAANERGIPYMSMPEAIGRFFLEGRHSIVVAGTHGKTSTSALLAWTLSAAGRDPSFLVGGVLRNFDRSYGVGRGAEFVIEGDEYESAFFDKGSKFLHYRPRTAVVTSVEYDHAEMFPDLAAVMATFRKFVGLLPVDGELVYCADEANAGELIRDTRARTITYGTGAEASWRGRVIGSSQEGMEFEVLHKGRSFGVFRTPLSGLHNLRNALAVVAVSHLRGLRPAAIAAAFRTFAGIKRRQEVLGSARGVLVLDDFAHHPTEVRATLEAIRERYRGRLIWGVFEPRTNTSRRSVFQDEYARSFDAADRVVIAGVDHPERAPEGQRFSPERLIADLRARGVDSTYVPSVEGIVELLVRQARESDVVLVMSNGTFGGIHEKILAALLSRC